MRKFSDDENKGLAVAPELADFEATIDRVAEGPAHGATKADLVVFIRALVVRGYRIGRCDAFAEQLAERDRP